MPNHALLDRAVALRQRIDQVRDEVVLLPRLGELVALARLLVVVGAGQALPGQAALDGRALLVVGRVLRLTQTPVIDGS
jgi:hypothetical protein